MSRSQESFILTRSYQRTFSSMKDKEEKLNSLRSAIEVSEKLKAVDIDIVESAFERLVKERDDLKIEKEKFMMEKERQETELASMDKEKYSMLNEVKRLKKQTDQQLAVNKLLHEKLKKFEVERQSRSLQNTDQQSSAEGRESIRVNVNETKKTADDLDIPSLCDPNRPLRLAEKYLDLLNNQWVDAKEELNLTEEDSINILLQTLKTCYHFCKDVADKQLEDLHYILEAPVHEIKPKARRSSSSSNPNMMHNPVERHANKLIRDCRQCFTEDASKEVVEQSIQNLPDQINQVNTTFVKRCTELCWFMVVQEPPMILGEEAFAGDIFDPNIYRVYDSSGVVVKYTVWLPLLMHDKGPLLCKGVVKLF